MPTLSKEQDRELAVEPYLSTANDPIDDVVTMCWYVIRHRAAGRNAGHPKFLQDLVTLGFNIDKTLDAIYVPASTDGRVAFIVREVVRQGRRMENLVSIATDIRDAAAKTDADAAAAADRVTAAIAALRGELQAAADRIAELIAAAPTPEDAAALQEALTLVQSADGRVDSIEPAPVEPPTA